VISRDGFSRRGDGDNRELSKMIDYLSILTPFRINDHGRPRSVIVSGRSALIDGQLHDDTTASGRSRRGGGSTALSSPLTERTGVHLRPEFRAKCSHSWQPGRLPGGSRPVVELLSADRPRTRGGVPANCLSAGFPGQAGLVERALENKATLSMPGRTHALLARRKRCQAIAATPRPVSACGCSPSRAFVTAHRGARPTPGRGWTSRSRRSTRRRTAGLHAIRPRRGNRLSRRHGGRAG
jgi:hypothetical protein